MKSRQFGKCLPPPGSEYSVFPSTVQIFIFVISLLVSYGCETWSHVSRKTKAEDVREQGAKEGIYSSPDIIKKKDVDRTCGTKGKKMKAYRVLIGNPEGRRPKTFRRSIHRWKDSVKNGS